MFISNKDRQMATQHLTATHNTVVNLTIRFVFNMFMISKLIFFCTCNNSDFRFDIV